MVEERTGFLNIAAHEFIFWLRRVAIRRLECNGREDVPTRGGAVVVANHGNGLIDGAILLETLPRLSSVLSKKPLFSTPIAGQILTAMNAMPVVRKQDAVTGTNTALFGEVHEHLRGGGSITVFPEGISHDEAVIMPLKTGAARMALGGDARWIIPAGLYYEEKGRMRTDAVITYGVPLEVNEDDTVAELTSRIKTALESLIVSCPDKRLYRAVGRAVNVAMSSSLSERFEGMRSIISYFNTADDTERTDLLRRLEAIAALRWRDIDRVKATDYALVVMLAIPAAVGWLTSKPIDVVVAELSRLHSADPDIIPSSKVLGSTLFYPLSWIGLIVGFGTAISLSSALYVAVAWPVSLLARVHITWPLRRLWGSFFRRRQLHREPGWSAELAWLRDLAGVNDGDKS